MKSFSKLSKLKILDLSYSHIEIVESLAFEGLVSLADLYMQYNNISTLPTKAFWKLSKLQRLYLSYSHIKTIGILAFDGLDSLTQLDLSHNNIGTLPTKAFSKLSKLQRLYLSYSHIKTIEISAFEGLDNLQQLNLSHNNISILSTRMFSNLTKLVKLDLKNSQIQTVESFTFDGLQKLTTLDLRRNKIKALVSKSFANIPLLKHVYLMNNKIEKIEADAFTGTENLYEIHLSENLLSDIPCIGRQPGLQKLDLSLNQIVNATFPSTYRYISNKFSVDLSINKIGTLDRFTFSSLAGTTIGDMKLYNNNITVVAPGTFDPPASIQMLYLDYNRLNNEQLENVAVGCSRNQTTLEMKETMMHLMNLGIRLGICERFSSGYFFKKHQNLTIIRLTKDKLIQFISHDFPGKKNILAMDLSGMGISSFPKYLPSSLESLDLNGNKISVLYRNRISYLRRLRIILLASNGVTHLWQGAFSGLRNLEVIDLSQNKLCRLSSDVFDSLQNLEELHLGHNNISVLSQFTHPLKSLRVLDLSNNGIATIDKPFSESFPSLNTLNLEGNNLGKTVFKSKVGDLLLSGLTELKDTNIARNNIRNLPDLIFRDQFALKFLNLRMNQISGWDRNVFHFTSNIEKIDIRKTCQ